jgi:hypothetical protein
MLIDTTIGTGDGDLNKSQYVDMFIQIWMLIKTNQPCVKEDVTTVHKWTLLSWFDNVEYLRIGTSRVFNRRIHEQLMTSEIPFLQQAQTYKLN